MGLFKVLFIVFLTLFVYFYILYAVHNIEVKKLVREAEEELANLLDCEENKERIKELEKFIKDRT